MHKQLLINMAKYREYKDHSYDGIYPLTGSKDGLHTIRELAVFAVSCRKCEDAPCIAACPAKALEKDNGGFIRRSIHLCVRCKTCIYSCPFGTMPGYIFDMPEKNILYNFKNEEDLIHFANVFPDDVVKLIDSDQNEYEDTYLLNEKVRIKDFQWKE